MGRGVCRSTAIPGGDEAGEGAIRGSVIETRQTTGGARVSTIRRSDGSTFTVTVPVAAMDDEATEGGAWAASWISGDRAGHPPPASSLLRLATLVSLGSARRPGLRLGRPALAVR